MTDTNKNPIPRGKSATMAKNKYRDKKYDRMELTLPKGTKILITDLVKEGKADSNNDYVVQAIKEKYLKDTGKELEL